MGNRDRANKNEIEIFVLSVTSNDLSHDILLSADARIRVRTCKSHCANSKPAAYGFGVARPGALARLTFTTLSG